MFFQADEITHWILGLFLDQWLYPTHCRTCCPSNKNLPAPKTWSPLSFCTRVSGPVQQHAAIITLCIVGGFVSLDLEERLFRPQKTLSMFAVSVEDTPSPDGSGNFSFSPLLYQHPAANYMEPVLQVKQQIMHREYVAELLFWDEEDLVLFFDKWNTTPCWLTCEWFVMHTIHYQ